MPYVTLADSSDNRVKVPDTEYLILTILKDRVTGLPAPNIADASNGEISVESVYTLLKRMVKRGVLERKEEELKVADFAHIKRICYKVKEGVRFTT